MTDNRTNESYFNWLYDTVNHNSRRKPTYRKLLRCLDSIDFRYIIPMDSNRFEDGINLRYRFGEENGYDGSYIANTLDTKPCSVLEMMVALALRIEESIMDNPSKGDRTELWFWTMIESLGLTSMDDIAYNENYICDCIEIFLDRKYEPNGKGGLFVVDGISKDLRDVQIWYQAMYYLNGLS